jgi:hypothetical protein
MLSFSATKMLKLMEIMTTVTYIYVQQNLNSKKVILQYGTQNLVALQYNTICGSSQILKKWEIDARFAVSVARSPGCKSKNEREHEMHLMQQRVELIAGPEKGLGLVKGRKGKERKEGKRGDSPLLPLSGPPTIPSFRIRVIREELIRTFRPTTTPTRLIAIPPPPPRKMRNHHYHHYHHYHQAQATTVARGFCPVPTSRNYGVGHVHVGDHNYLSGNRTLPHASDRECICLV